MRICEKVISYAKLDHTMYIPNKYGSSSGVTYQHVLEPLGLWTKYNSQWCTPRNGHDCLKLVGVVESFLLVLDTVTEFSHCFWIL